MHTSCGIIPFKVNENGELQFLLGHPGGHYANCRDLWLFLKGAVENNETWKETAIREFKEETGLALEDVTEDMLIPLGSVQQNPHKVTVAFGLHYPNIDPSKCYSNMVNDFTPEIDNYRWMNYDDVCRLTHHTHIGFYNQLVDMNKYSGF